MSVFREEIRRLAAILPATQQHQAHLLREARVTQELLRVKYENLGDFGGTDPVDDSYYLEVAGPTFEYRNTLKQLGLKWVPNSKSWRLDATLYRYNTRARALAWDRARKLQQAAIPVLNQLAKEHNTKAELANRALRPEKGTRDFVQMINRQERLRERLEESGLLIKWKVPGKYEVDETKVLVHGNTYPYVALMKKYGFKWDPSAKGWWLPGSEYVAIGDKWMGEIIRTLPKAQPDNQAYTSVLSDMSDRDLTTFLSPVIDRAEENSEGWDGESSWGEEMAGLKLRVRRMSPKEQTEFYHQVKSGHYNRLASMEDNMNDGTNLVRLAELRAARSQKQAAVAKIPLFGRGKFDVTVTAKEIIPLVLEHYPQAVVSSFKFDTKVGGSGSNGEIYVGFQMDNADPNGEWISGSVKLGLSPWSQGVRSYAFINIDG